MEREVKVCRKTAYFPDRSDLLVDREHLLELGAGIKRVGDGGKEGKICGVQMCGWWWKGELQQVSFGTARDESGGTKGERGKDCCQPPASFHPFLNSVFWISFNDLMLKSNFIASLSPLS